MCEIVKGREYEDENGDELVLVAEGKEEVTVHYKQCANLVAIPRGRFKERARPIR